MMTMSKNTYHRCAFFCRFIGVFLILQFETKFLEIIACMLIGIDWVNFIHYNKINEK